MTKTELYSIAIKIFGLYFLVVFIEDVFGATFYSAGLFSSSFESPWYMYVSIFGKSLVDFAVFYIATLRTDLVLKRFFKTDDSQVHLTLLKFDWLELAISIIGVIAIINAIPNLLNVVVGQVYYRNDPEAFGLGNEKAPIFLEIFKLAVGILTILNARNLAKFIVKRGERDDEYDRQNER